MGRNLIGYFGAMPDCNQYSVKIITDTANTEYNEIHLAGTSPFVVNYNVSKTPFDPVRYSRATITVVASNYLFDVFSSDVQGTKVVLTNEETNTIEWVGYLTSNLLNMPQDSCGLETFSLDAQDCLSTLESYNYELVSTAKTIVKFSQILSQIARRCGQITELYVDATIRNANNSYIYLDYLDISEQNFFSSDTDEPWNLKEVLEEICRYLGYTAIQYKTMLYLVDMQSLSTETWNSGTTTGASTMARWAYKFTSADDFTTESTNYYNNLSKKITLDQSMFRGTGSDISLEAIYNKIVVKDSFYEIDHFIPDMFKDEKLTNRDGNFWNCNSIHRSGKFRYIGKKGWTKTEEKDENEHVYYIRKFDHENYSSIYRDHTTMEEVTNWGSITVTNVEQNQDDGSGYTGTYDITATFVNKSNTSHSIYVHAYLDYRWWDNEHQMYDYGSYPQPEDSTTFTLTAAGTANSANTINLHCANDHDYYQFTKDYGATYRIDGGAANSLSEGQADTQKYVGATIVDLASFDKPMATNKYNYETEASINFDRYLMIHQLGKPTELMNPYWTWYFNQTLTPLRDSQIETYFKPVFRLNSGYTNPMIIDDKTYLYINATAIWERYNQEYINPDWTDENSNIGGLGVFSKTARCTTTTPTLIFKLKIGNKYWSSSSNSWVRSNSCFCVKMATDKTDEDDVDFTGWWNEDHAVLNNISWTDWAGAKGYKIPLNSSLDFSKNIEFWVMLPSRIQDVDTDESYDGINNYCWVKDFEMGITTKDSENYDNADVIYENVIDSGSVNTLSDITCKITTYAGEGMHSYSNVGYGSSVAGVDLLTEMRKIGLDANANKPEENIIKAYTNQYSTPTIKQTMTLDLSCTPFSKIYDPVLKRYFVVLGQEIDYQMGSQRLTLIENKPYSLN